MAFRRWVPFLLVNILVSATVVLVILYWWDQRQPEPTPVAVVPTIAVPTPILAQEGEVVAEQVDNTPEPTAEPTSEYPVYIIQPGDTLGNLSTQYDVPLEDIMLLNNLDNENFIQVGQQILIPVGGLPTATPPPTSTPLPPDTPSPVVPAGTPDIAGGAVQVEIATVEGLGTLTQEAILVVNNGSQPVSLEGWTLRDTEGHVYTFGQVTLFGDGAGIRVHTETGVDQATDLFWGLEQAIWEPQETVILRDADGGILSQYLIP